MANSDISIGFQAQGVTDLARQFSLVKKQIQSVEAPLVGATSKFKAFEKASITAGGAFRNIRAPIQNAAFQIQDIAVQLTMGTNSALVLAQQLPQLVSGFGAVGAVIGGVVAVGAGLVMAFQKTSGGAVTVKENLDNLKNTAASLKQVLDQATESTDELQKKFGEASGRIREINIELLELEKGRALEALQQQVSEVPDSLRRLAAPIKNLEESLDTEGMSGQMLTTLQQRLQAVRNELGLTGTAANRQAQVLQVQFTNVLKALTEGGGMENTRNALMLLKDTLDDTGVSVDKLPKGIRELMVAFLESEKATARINKLLDDSTKATENLASAEEDLTSLYLSQAEVTKRAQELESLKAQRIAKENDERVRRERILLKLGSDSLNRINLEIRALAERIRLTNEGKSKAEIEIKVQRELAIARYEASIAGIKDETKRNDLMTQFKASLDIRLSLQKKINEQQEKEKEQNLVLQDRVKLTHRLVELTKEAQALQNIPPATPMPRPRGIGDDGILDLTDPGGVAASFNEQAESIKRARDPLYAYLKDMELLRQNVQEGTDTFNIMEAEITKTFEDAAKRLDPFEKQLENLATTISSGFESSFMSVVDGSRKASDAFKDFASMVIKQLAKIALQKMVFGPLEQALTGFLGGTVSNTPASTRTGMLDIPARAAGGPVLGGKTYMVGEAGPELFTPRSSGKITPNHRMGGSGEQIVINQNINVTTGVQQTVRAEILGLMPQITEASKMAVIDAKRRGGSFAGAF